MSTEKKTVEITVPNMEMFIVPNSLGRVSNFFNADTRKEFLNQLAEINGWDPVNDDTVLVQLWFTDKEVLHSDNLVDHGANVDIDGEEYHMYVDSTFSFLPISLFDGKKEGDTVSIKMPNTVWRTSEGDREELEVILDMTIRLNQKAYRYSTYGGFDDVLQKLKANFERR